MGDWAIFWKSVIDVMKLEVSVYGFTFTFLELYLFGFISMVLIGLYLSFISGGE